MNTEQAKSELMQIYMSLSEEKKKALDVLMAQADGEYKTEKSCETCKHYGVFSLECGRCDKDMTNYAPKQANGEKSFKMRDATPQEQEAIDKYIKSISKPTGVNFWDLADGEYISKDKAIVQLSWDLSEVEVPRIKESLDKLPSVAIPNKTGHWEYNQYDGNPNIGNWHCSECRNIVSDMPTCMGKPLYEFCPHCGCPMEVENG